MVTFCKRLLWCLPVLCFNGCTWLPYAIDNTIGTFTGNIHEHRFLREAEDLSEVAWCEVGVGDLKNKRKTEYERGFKVGFVEYLDGNGDGTPPAAPPRRLRSHILRSDAEQRNIEDWFAGYRFGAQVAAQARYRDRIVIPISSPPLGSEESYSKQIVPARRQVGGDGSVPGVAVFE